MDDTTTRGRASGLQGSRVVQVHATRRCNLSCAHCYSSSGPGLRGELAPADLVARLASLRRQGYEVASFSGGEPLLYSGWSQVAVVARELGYRVNLITNGLLLTERRVHELRDLGSIVGVSLDGPRELHEAIRGRGTYDRTLRALDRLADAGVTFGIAHCVTRGSVAHLPDLVDLAIERGAKLLQLHPLTPSGRAVDQCADEALDQADLLRVGLMSKLFAVQAQDVLQIQLDLASGAQILSRRGSFAALEAASGAPPSLSDLVNPVVLDERGRLWPFAFGMAREQRVAAGDLAAWERDIDGFLATRGGPLAGLLSRALLALEERPTELVDWYELLVDTSFEREGLRQAAASA